MLSVPTQTSQVVDLGTFRSAFKRRLWYRRGRERPLDCHSLFQLEKPFFWAARVWPEYFLQGLSSVRLWGCASSALIWDPQGGQSCLMGNSSPGFGGPGCAWVWGGADPASPTIPWISFLRQLLIPSTFPLPLRHFEDHGLLAHLIAQALSLSIFVGPQTKFGVCWILLSLKLWWKGICRGFSVSFSSMRRLFPSFDCQLSEDHFFFPTFWPPSARKISHLPFFWSSLFYLHSLFFPGMLKPSCSCL